MASAFRSGGEISDTLELIENALGLAFNEVAEAAGMSTESFNTGLLIYSCLACASDGTSLGLIRELVDLSLQAADDTNAQPYLID